jgi:hypothetical protein
MSLKSNDISVGLLDQLIRHCPEMFTYMQSFFRSLMLTLQRIIYLYTTVTIIQNISQIDSKIKQKRSIHYVYLQNTLYTSRRRLKLPETISSTCFSNLFVTNNVTFTITFFISSLKITIYIFHLQCSWKINDNMLRLVQKESEFDSFGSSNQYTLYIHHTCFIITESAR